VARGVVRLSIWGIDLAKKVNPEPKIKHRLKLKKVNPEPKIPKMYSLTLPIANLGCNFSFNMMN
jgi:hypothetical protein